MLRQERESYNVSLMERMAKAAEGAASRVQLTQVLLALLVQKCLLYWYKSTNTDACIVQLTQRATVPAAFMLTHQYRMHPDIAQVRE